MSTTEGLTIIIGVASVIVAGLAAFFALAQSLHAREQVVTAETAYRDQVQPYVFADIRPDTKDPGVLVLVIENSGKTVARDVRITFNPPLQSVALPGNFSGHEATELAALPPGRTMTWLFDIGFRLFEADSPRRYRVKITGDGPFGKIEPVIYDLNLNEYQQHEARDTGTMKSLVKAIDKNTDAVMKVIAELKAHREKPN